MDQGFPRSQTFAVLASIHMADFEVCESCKGLWVECNRALGPFNHCLFMQ